MEEAYCYSLSVISSCSCSLNPGRWVQLQPLLPLVDEFAARLFGELDYIQEGKNSEKFASLYGKVPRVRVPKVYWQYTARRVLCMEWIEGALCPLKLAVVYAACTCQPCDYWRSIKQSVRA